MTRDNFDPVWKKLENTLVFEFLDAMLYGETHFWKEIVTQSRAWGAVRRTFGRKL